MVKRNTPTKSVGILIHTKLKNSFLTISSVAGKIAQKSTVLLLREFDKDHPEAIVLATTTLMLLKIRLFWSLLICPESSWICSLLTFLSRKALEVPYS